MLKILTVLCGPWMSLAAVSLAAVSVAQADPAAVSGPDVIAARQASLDMSSITFHSMGEAMKAGREAKSQAYPAAALAKWAEALARMFPPGTGKGETAVSTRALDAVWRDRAGFEQAAANYAATTSQLAALANASDTVGFTRQLDEVNQACRSCHSRYKEGDQGAPHPGNSAAAR